MTVTLSEATAAALQDRATRLGVTVNEFVRDVLDREALTETTNAMTGPATIDTFFQQLRELSSKATQVLDPRFSRESIYQDHD